MRSLGWVVGMALCAACNSEQVVSDAGRDAGRLIDAGGDVDAGGGTDAGMDAGPITTDAGVDAGSTDAGDPWPTCDSQPAGSDEMTIPEIWAANPSSPTPAWVPGVYVTAVSRGACTAGMSCQFFVQQQESYASLAAATRQSLRVAVAPAVSSYFVGITVGSHIDLFGHALRDTTDGDNELLFLVTATLSGCAAILPVSGDPQPVTVTLDDLTLAAYEDTIGPVLVRVDTVSGNPNAPAQTFALWDTGGTPGGDITTVTSLSPFFHPGAAFTGLTMDQITDFEYVVGVFGIFSPPAVPLIKYEEIYVRSAADYPIAP